jgi:ribonuclease VapC
MKKKHLLDSFALLTYLNQEKGYEKVKLLLSSEKSPLLMNEINIGETFYILAKRRNLENAEYFLNVILPALPITYVGNALQDVIAAARIKASHPISYADCFVIATALKEKAAIVTGDPEFRHVEDLVTIEWL